MAVSGRWGEGGRARGVSFGGRSKRGEVGLTPVLRDFYGGWVTSNIKGKMKGGESFGYPAVVRC